VLPDGVPGKQTCFPLNPINLIFDSLERNNKNNFRKLEARLTACFLRDIRFQTTQTKYYEFLVQMFRISSTVGEGKNCAFTATRLNSFMFGKHR
jgi:hypothetical protein